LGIGFFKQSVPKPNNWLTLYLVAFFYKIGETR